MEDVFLLIGVELKRLHKQAGITVDQEIAATTQEVAWSCIKTVHDLAIIVPMSDDQILHAMSYRSLHVDFEDNLIMAAAKRTHVDLLIT